MMLTFGPPTFVDSHTHLDDGQFENDLDPVLDTTRRSLVFVRSSTLAINRQGGGRRSTFRPDGRRFRSHLASIPTTRTNSVWICSPT